MPKRNSDDLSKIKDGELINFETAEKYLSESDLAWCYDYLTHFNGAKAVRNVFGGINTEHAVHSKAQKLKNHPVVKSFLAYLIKENLDERAYNLKRTMQEVSNNAFANLKDMVDENGDVVPLKDMDRDTAAAISSLEVEVVGTMGEGESQVQILKKKLKLNDKNAALKTLCQYHGVLKSVVSGDPDNPIKVSSEMSEEVKGLMSGILKQKTSE